MKRYAIADYLSLDQRRAIALADYPSTGSRLQQRITDQGQCPLGILDDQLAYATQNSAPSGDVVALALLIAMDDNDRNAVHDETGWLDLASDLIQEFIDDWDSGAIAPAELPEALGLYPSDLQCDRYLVNGMNCEGRPRLTPAGLLCGWHSAVSNRRL